MHSLMFRCGQLREVQHTVDKSRLLSSRGQPTSEFHRHKSSAYRQRLMAEAEPLEFLKTYSNLQLIWCYGDLIKVVKWVIFQHDITRIGSWPRKMWVSLVLTQFPVWCAVTHFPMWCHVCSLWDVTSSLFCCIRVVFFFLKKKKMRIL